MPLFCFELLQTSCCKFYVYFRIFRCIAQRPYLDHHEKVLCQSCGSQITKLNHARHKKSCSAGTLYCTQCSNFSIKSQAALIDHIAKKHSAPKPDVALKWNIYYEGFLGFYVLQHQNTQHGFPIKTANVEPDDVLNEVNDSNLKEELRSCQQFPVDSEVEKAKYKVFIYALEKKPQPKNSGRDDWSLLPQFEVCSETESSFWGHFKNYRI